jgi:hypothetical protein
MEDDVHDETDDTGGDGDKPDGAINGVFHGTTQQNWWGTVPRSEERGTWVGRTIRRVVPTDASGGRRSVKAAGRRTATLAATGTPATGEQRIDPIAVSRRISSVVNTLPLRIEYSTNHVPK